ncbi:hypothetical protein BDV95DRAFT_155721 [Massariosphaeria phaeospora]|uniref:Uncharacterized protein n=1 Tax=Massariosphaeria phaeospora TaxID=100035 RepID=A0A7C8IEY4_9PLEO|nr:hypothetical protein BDV95DRAFT_155721 [Massariosphaeria phaeospora]
MISHTDRRRRPSSCHQFLRATPVPRKYRTCGPCENVSSSYGGCDFAGLTGMEMDMDDRRHFPDVELCIAATHGTCCSCAQKRVSNVTFFTSLYGIAISFPSFCSTTLGHPSMARFIHGLETHAVWLLMYPDENRSSLLLLSSPQPPRLPCHDNS